jgi:hypothetical protein
MRKIMMAQPKGNTFFLAALAKPSRFLRNLRRNQSGLALTEFAMSMPIFMGLGMYGTETAYRAVAQMQVSQAALALADNASRIGQTGNTAVQPTIQDSDIVEALVGTRLQTQSLDLLENGRVILSSLEVRRIAAEGNRPQQYIRWQRCKGMRNYTSAYADGVNTTDSEFTGVGPTGGVRAIEGSAVMYVEIEYEYQPLFGDLFAEGIVMNQEAAFTIRDDRNLANGINNDLNPTSLAATCNKFDAS